MNEEQDPYLKMIDTLSVVEQYNRAVCLIAVYIGQQMDHNTIKGITEIFRCLFHNPKGQNITTAKVRGLLTSLVNGNLLEREQERMISSTKVSFHHLSLIGYISLLNLFYGYIIGDPLKEIEFDDRSYEILDLGIEEDIIKYFVRKSIYSQKVTAKLLTEIKSGKKLEKIKNKPLIFNIPKTFSGNIIKFRMLEELIFDLLTDNLSIEKSYFAEKFSPTPIGSHINKLKPFISDEQIGKSIYLKLSIKGIYTLPILAFYIKHLSAEPYILPKIISGSINKEENPWLILIKGSKKFYRNLFSL